MSTNLSSNNFEAQNPQQFNTCGNLLPRCQNQPTNYNNQWSSNGNQHSYENIPFQNPLNNSCLNNPANLFPGHPSQNLNRPPTLPPMGHNFRGSAHPNDFCPNSQGWGANTSFFPPPPRFPHLQPYPDHGTRGFPSQNLNYNNPPPGYHPESNNRDHSAREDVIFNEDSPRVLVEPKSKEEALTTWVQNWVSIVAQRMEANKKVKKLTQIKISDIQEKLLKYASITKELELVLEDLSGLDESGEEWEALYKRAESLKAEAKHLRCFFEVDNIKKIQNLLKERREKRKRARNTKKRRNEKWKILKCEWKEKEEKIDQRLDRLHKEEKAKINEEKMKLEADSILREVRTKQEETLRMQKLLRVLTTLREGRLKKGDVHGFVTSQQANSFFAKFKEEFDKLIPDQLSLYESEEQTLRVMMEESQSSLPKENKLTRKTPNVEKLQNEIHEIFFGKMMPYNLQNEYQRSFTSADESVEVLVNRRTDWDQYLVREENPLGSSIPIGWVVPNMEPNPDWKQLQVK